MLDHLCGLQYRFGFVIWVFKSFHSPWWGLTFVLLECQALRSRGNFRDRFGIHSHRPHKPQKFKSQVRLRHRSLFCIVSLLLYGRGQCSPHNTFIVVNIPAALSVPYLQTLGCLSLVKATSTHLLIFSSFFLSPSENKFSEPGAIALAAALSALTTLENVDLRLVKIYTLEYARSVAKSNSDF